MSYSEKVKYARETLLMTQEELAIELGVTPVTICRWETGKVEPSKDGIAFTLKANMGTYPNRVPIIKDKFGIRRITPMECLALQGFPSNFTFPSTVRASSINK